MKVRPSVKPMCEKCKIIKRKGKVMVICENPKHTRAKSWSSARTPSTSSARVKIRNTRVGHSRRQKNPCRRKDFT